MNDFCVDYIVRYNEVDRHGHLKLRTLFDFSQETAAWHTRQFGLDTIQIHEKHYAWILSRIKYRILSYPTVQDLIHVQTYPCGYDRIFALREYRLRDKNGQLLALASSSWLLMDTQKMKILNVHEMLENLFPDNPEEKVQFPDLRKLPMHLEHPEWEARYEIHETMLDINNHLNNSEYAGFVQDFLGEKRCARELQINFQASVPPESVLTVRGQTEPENRFLVLGYLGEKIAFQSEGIFEHYRQSDMLFT